MSTYTYYYDPSGNPPDEHGRYDEETREAMLRNNDESMKMDYNGSRRRFAPTSEQLRRRVESWERAHAIGQERRDNGRAS